MFNTFRWSNLRTLQIPHPTSEGSFNSSTIFQLRDYHDPDAEDGEGRGTGEPIRDVPRSYCHVRAHHGVVTPPG